MSFGSHIRARRLALLAQGQSLSLRRFAARFGIEPAYRSKLERDIFAPSSEAPIMKIAQGLDEDLRCSALE